MRPISKNSLGQFFILKAGLYLLFAVSILVMSLSTPHTALARPLMDAIPGVSVNIPSPVMLGEDFSFTVANRPSKSTVNPGPTSIILEGRSSLGLPQKGIGSGLFRPLYAATPSLALGIPATTPLGENFTFTASFSNAGADPGYGPFIDIVLPATGTDGIYPGTGPGEDYDGVSFVSASFGGLSIPSDQIFIQTFPDDSGGTGCVQHPIAVRPAGGPNGHGGANPESPVYYDACGPAGYQYITIILPFGSFVPAQPAAEITITAAMSELADLNTALNIYGQAGFRFGETAINDFCCNPWDATLPVDGDGIYDIGDLSEQGQVEPSLLSISKTYVGPEDETATGPNFPRQFTISVDIADSQVIGIAGDPAENLEITDTLPDNIQYLSIDSSSPPGATCTTTPDPLNTPGGEFTCSFDSVTGSTGLEDAWITFNFYVDRLDEYSSEVLDSTTGSPAVSGNTASVTGPWDPIDSRDDTVPIPTASANCGVPCVSIQDQSIVVQKGYLNITDGNTNNSPGDYLEYTLEFQISDFFGFQSIDITDTFSDGQRFDTTFTPTIQLNGNGGNDIAAGSPMNAANVDIDCLYSGASAPSAGCDTASGVDEGQTTIVFNISDELISLFSRGQLLGGCVDPTAANAPPSCSSYNDGATEGTITFRTVIQDEFSDEHMLPGNSGDASVDHGDILSNDVETIIGEVLDISVPPVSGEFSGNGNYPTDDSTVGVAINFGVLTKDVYAVNGSTSLPPYVSPGDVITYRLTYTQPTSDFEETVLTDFFPLPVFDATEITILTNQRCEDVPYPNNVPPAGEICLGPADDYHNLNSRGELVPPGNLVVTPTFVTNGAANSLEVTYAEYDSVYNIDSTFDLLISLTVEADPFADGLFLTNQATSAEGTTNAGDQDLTDIVQIRIGEPELYTAKTAVSTNHLPDTDLEFIPDAPLSGSDLTAFESLIAQFAAPGGSGVPFSGTITSQDISTDPNDVGAAFDLFNSTLEGVDGEDLVKYAILIENRGHSANGAYDIAISDLLPPEMDYPNGNPANLNLQVYNGIGVLQDFEVITSYGADGKPGGGDDVTVPGTAANAFNLFDPNLGIRVIDPAGIDPPGACQVASLTSGENILVITYDLQLNNGLPPDTEIINTVSLLGYGAEEGGENFLETPEKDDAVVITNPEPDFDKVLTSTEIDNVNNTNTQVVIGEILTYTLNIKFFELEYTTVSIVDTLDPGLSFVDLISVTNSNPDTDGAGPDTGLTSTVMSFDGAGNCTNCTAGTTPGSSNPLVENNGGTITFDFGDLTNNDEDNTIDEVITIVYRAVATNVVTSDAGDVLGNSAELSWDSDNLIDDDNDATLLEPVINTEKISSVAAADAGDSFTYTITLTNPNSADDTDAFDADFADNFPMCPVPTDGSAVIGLTLNSQSGPATFVLSGDDTNGYSLDASGFDLAPGETATVEIEGEIAYCVNPGNSLDNTGTTTWTSLSGDYTTPDGTIPVPRSEYNLDSVERTGANGVGGALNDYASEDTASIAIDTPTNSKYIIDTSELHTGYVNGIDNVAIGEIVRYRIVSSIPEGTSPNFQVRDRLPGGLIFRNDDTSVIAFVSDVGITSTGIGSLPVPAIPASCNQVGSTANASTPVMDPTNCTLADYNIGSTASTSFNVDTYDPGTDPRFKLGQLVNNDSDTDVEYVVIEFNALVHNSATHQNNYSQQRINYAQVFINGEQEGSDSNEVRVRIAEPIIAVTKTIIPPTPSDAGDAIEYEIIFSNDAVWARKATAFDLVLSDNFDTYLENLSVTSVTSSQGDWTNPAVICDGDGDGTTDFDLTESLVGHTLTVNVSCLDPGESVTLRITGNVVDGVPASTTLYNTAIGTGTSLPGDNGTTGNPTGSNTPGASGTDNGERDGSDTDTGGQDDLYDSDDADHTLVAPGISKTVEAPAQWTIGETFTYDLVITLPEGVTPDMVVYDDIPVGLEYLSHNIITAAGSGSLLAQDYDGTLPAPSVNAPGGSGGDLTLDFGDTTTNEDNPDDPNDNSFQVQITVRMLNVIENQNGDILTNLGELQYSGGTAATDTVDVQVLEPVLDVEKTTNPDPAVDLDAGDTVQYSVTISHDQDGAPPLDSQSDAFDVTLDDLLDGGSRDILITSIDSTILTGSASVDSAAVITGGGTGISGQYDIPMGDTVTVTYTAELQESIRPDQTLANDVDITWSSLQGNPDEARDGSGGVDDYFSGTSVNVDTRDLLSITKEVIDSNQTHTSGNDLTIGEEVTYRMVVTVIEGTTDSVVVTDTLPDNLNFILGTVVVTPNGPGMTTGYTAPPAWADPVLTIDLGQVINPADGNPANDTITIEFEALVENDVINQNETAKTNNVEVTDGNLTDTASADVDIVEPVLDVSKLVDDSTPALGQTITYTLVIAHDLDGSGEDSHADAFDINLVDTLPTGLSNLTNINITTNPVSCATGIDSSTSTTSELNVSIDSIPHQPPAPGCVVTITFDATVDSPPSPTTPAAGSSIDNTAEITWTSLAGDDANERTGDDGAGGLNDYVDDGTETITITNPDLRVTKDDGVVVYVPGLTVVYDIVIENVGNEDVNDALVEDVIPAQLNSWDWVCADATGGATGCTAVSGSSSDFSDNVNLPAGSSITYQVTANILSSATGDMTNTVTVTMPDGYIEPTPDDNTDSDTDTQDSQADLSVSKDDGVTLISPGTTITYDIVVSNLSPSDVSGAVVTDSIPAEIDSWTWTCAGTTGGASGCTPAPNSALNFSDTIDLPASSSITYSVTAQVSAAASGTLTNVVTVTAPAGVTETNLDNNTDDDVDSFPENNKNLVDQQHGVTTLPDVAIGEVLTYEVVLTVPVGSMANLHLVDTLDRGLAFVACDVITGPGLTTNGSADFSSVCASPAVSTYPSGSTDDEDLGRQVDFNFGTLANNSEETADLTVRYEVVVLDSLENQGSGSTTPLNNQAEWIWDSGQFSDQAVGVLILEPDLTLTKDVYPNVVYPGQTITFTLVVDHSAISEIFAYDLELTDIVPAGLTYITASIRHVSGQAPSSLDDTGAPTLVVGWAAFDNTAGNSVIEFDVVLDSNISRTHHNQFISNEASLSWTSLPGDFSTAQSTHNPLSTERFYDPLSNVNIYGVGDNATVRIPALPDTGFAPGKVTPLPIQSEDQIYGDLGGLQVEIPKLGLSVPIVSIPQSDQGWDLTWLWNQAGWLEGTAYPSWYGNTVITGHAYLSNGLPGPFVDLGTLSWGDEIILYAHGLKYTYQVRVEKLVPADDLSILDHKDQDWLTIFTCKEFSETLDEYLWRQVVQAVLVGVEQLD